MSPCLGCCGIFFAFGIAISIMMQHRFIRGGDWNAGRASRGALAGEQARPWPGKDSTWQLQRGP